MTPEKISKYNIVRTIGKGAMGVVYEGFDPDIERRVAIKTLHPHLTEGSEGEEFLIRFKREAQSAARCMHPNIVLVLEYGIDDGTPFIAMEYVEGTELKELLNDKKELTLKQVLSIISQVLKALHAAHKQGVVHRDIKPANIMVLSDCMSKLADFGIARVENTGELTQVGAMIGTPRFMAPEQTFGQTVDHRADLFSTTMIFHELLCKLPLALPMEKKMLGKVDGLPPNNKLNHIIEIPSAFIPVIQKGLAIRPEDRFQSAQEFATAIKQALAPFNKKSVTSSGPEPLEISKRVDPNSTEALELETLLTNFVGDNAKKLITQQSKHSQSIAELVDNVVHEIPSEQSRKSFLSKWQQVQFDNNSISSLGHANNEQLTEYTSENNLVDDQHTMVSNLDDDTLNKLQREFAHFVGPMASRLIKHHASNALSMAELIHNLAADIPSDSEREHFLDQWSQ